MSGRKELEFEGAASAAEVADTLCRLADGIRARALFVSLGDDEITVQPDGDIALQIAATEKKSKTRIEIAIAWRHRAPAASASPEEVADVLRALAAGLRRGEVSLESPKRSVRVATAGDLKLALEVVDQGSKGKILLQIGWKRRAAIKDNGLRVDVGHRPAPPA